MIAGAAAGWSRGHDGRGRLAGAGGRRRQPRDAAGLLQQPPQDEARTGRANAFVYFIYYPKYLNPRTFLQRKSQQRNNSTTARRRRRRMPRTPRSRRWSTAARRTATPEATLLYHSLPTSFLLHFPFTNICMYTANFNNILYTITGTILRCGLCIE